MTDDVALKARELTPNERELVALLRREGRYSGVWFAEHLLAAADLIESLSRDAASQASTEAILGGIAAIRAMREARNLRRSPQSKGRGAGLTTLRRNDRNRRGRQRG